MTTPIHHEALFPQARRVHYFPGRLLTAADFEQDQQYQRDMRYLHNRALGFGVVEGLAVHATPTGITVSPGFALDPYGREVVLAHAVHLDADDTLLSACPNPVVTATWAEAPSGPGDFTSWVEQPAISIEPRETMASPTLVLASIRRRRKAGLLISKVGRQNFAPRTASKP